MPKGKGRGTVRGMGKIEGVAIGVDDRDRCVGGGGMRKGGVRGSLLADLGIGGGGSNRGAGGGSSYGAGGGGSYLCQMPRGGGGGGAHVRVRAAGHILRRVGAF